MQPSAANEEQRRSSSKQTKNSTKNNRPTTVIDVGLRCSKPSPWWGIVLAVYNNALLNTAPQEDLATPWLVESEPFAPLEPCNEGGFASHRL